MNNSIDRITHTTAFVTPVVEHWLEREIAQWVHPIAPWANAITTELHLAPTKVQVHASKDDVQAFPSLTYPSLCLKIIYIYIYIYIYVCVCVCVCVCVYVCVWAWLLIFDIIIIIISLNIV